MDPNQTTRTTPSRVNDIDPIGSDSGTEVTPTGLTGANDATNNRDATNPFDHDFKSRSISSEQSDIDPRTSRGLSLEPFRGHTIHR
ncbi:hypothetical protein F2Q69_00042997 [Brassica cretica]|uniref:Uncharacterized protein n=1 Tax=Brassica cretica TaxID=69181 RepID=A0A8S9NRM9_BRACR|nr:hypothetical protein F2Q69_00042997 [Brassica cretica]